MSQSSSSSRAVNLPSVVRRRLLLALSLVLIYLLVVLLVAPLSVRRVAAQTGAGSPTDAGGGASPSETSPPPQEEEQQSQVRIGVPAPTPPPRRERELVVRFAESVSDSGRLQILSLVGAQRLRRLGGPSRLERVELPLGLGLDVIAAQLRALPGVEAVEPNYLVAKEDTTPDDARFAEQWALRNTGQTGGQAGADINAVAAWDRTTGSAATVVAVIDSGIDFTHPDLTNNRWINSDENASTPADDDQNGFVNDTHGWDWVGNDNTPNDEQGHGTSVAGVVAAHGNNQTGTSGAMWRASIMNLRVLDNTGTGDLAAAVEAIDYAADNGAHVINASWGTAADSVFLKEAILRAGTKGVVFVCAAGNAARDIDQQAYYPASYDLPNLISVAASDHADQLASSSNWGAERVTIAAPGTNILTTKMGGGYRLVSGTSAAAPLVAGIAGLIKTLNPSIVSSVAVAAIKDGVRVVPQMSAKSQTEGIADADGALLAMNTATAPVPTPPPGGWTPAPTPRPPTPGAPAGMPSLDEVLNSPKPPTGAPPPRVSSDYDLPCIDCDPSGGGGYTPPGGDPLFARPRLDMHNETGRPGVSLNSRNHNWSVPLVGLPGRSGMDLGVALYYNSLVWVKQGNGIRYDTDRGQPTPGFRIGFPILQGPYTSAAGSPAYVMVTPSGGHIEMRFSHMIAGTTNVFYSADTQFTELVQHQSGTATVRTKDGTQYRFYHIGSGPYTGQYNCDQIKDRNGNYLSIGYNGSQRVSTVTDTLGRVINFNYDAQNYLASITQNRGGSTFTWATFGYGQIGIGYNFPGLTVSGVPQSGTVGVLTQVGLPDGSKYTFDYTVYGQVHQIKRYATDGTSLLALTFYNLPGSTSTPQTDCPRFTYRQDWSFLGLMNADGSRFYNYATDDSTYAQVTMPDGTVHKEFYHSSGDWKKGLTYRTETWSGSTLKRYTTTDWTQDNTNLAYPDNPRVGDVSVYDEAGRRRRTSYNFLSAGDFHLPYEILEYVNNGTSVYRRTELSYRFDQVYKDKRVLGLPNVKLVKDGNGALLQKLDYHYDWGHDDWYVQQEPAMGHDAGYNSPAGRGNLVGVRRWNKDFPNDDTKATWVKLHGYNGSGSVIFNMDGEFRRTNIGYQDNFTDGNQSRNARAYPVQITDADNFSSWLSYNFHTGRVVGRADPKGVLTITTYDGADRVQRIDNNTSGAYTRYEYGWIYSASYGKVAAGQPEVLYEEHYDGDGRIRATAATFPGSAGGRRAVHNMWDSMGRLQASTNPTEINGSWAPVGDDHQGWRWSANTYDWMGRVTRVDQPDNTYVENVYNACGCAGGDTTTTYDEKRRRKDYIKDALGRLEQVIEYNGDWAGGSATTVYYYDALDRLVNTNQSGQWRGWSYDGLGRLHQRTTPEQGTTTYSYYNNDLPHVVTDARGATATHVYNNRNLLQMVYYGVPNPNPHNVQATGTVTYAYDQVGNRTQMDDQYGVTDYGYNTLSQMTSETRKFDNLNDVRPGGYTIGYGYNWSGQLTSVTTPWGEAFGYNRDAAGAVTSVSNNYAGNTPIINGVAYRAWGAAKSVAYGNGRTLSLVHDERMRPTQWHIPGVMRWDYGYMDFNEKTGRVTHAYNVDDRQLDRSFAYDDSGRLRYSHTGMEARAHVNNSGVDGLGYGPYAHHYAYDVFGNITSRNGWGNTNASYTATYTNNRRDGWSYDAAGNFTHWGQFLFDATGQMTNNQVNSVQQWYDGDRLRVIKAEPTYTTYYLRSTVLGGQVLSDIEGTPGNGHRGGWRRQYVYVEGQLAAQIHNGEVWWEHVDPVAKSRRTTNWQGNVVTQVEVDPWGLEPVASSGRTWSTGDYWRNLLRFTTYERDGDGYDEAMNRRYTSYWSRFVQPDPYGGSYDLSDPQSFNRYAYVQNDPVNFTDPTGLVIEPEQPAFEGAGNPMFSYRDSGGGSGYFWFFPYWHNAEGQIDFGPPMLVPTGGNAPARSGVTAGGGGNGGGSQASDRSNQEPLPFNNCFEFVDYLVGRAIHYSKQVLFDDSKAINMGLEMMHTAKGEYDRHINNGFEGFKDILVEPGRDTPAGRQGAGVYGHVLGQGGAKLAGVTIVIGGLADFYDTAQRVGGHSQGPAEMAGNRAGWEVGKHIWNFLSGRTPREPERLGNSLRSELCK